MSEKKRVVIGIIIALFAIVALSSSFITLVIFASDIDTKEKTFKTNVVNSIELDFKDEIKGDARNEQPYQYLLSYTIKNEKDLFKEDTVYVFEFDRNQAKSVFLEMFKTDSSLHTYEKVMVEGSPFYVLSFKESGFKREKGSQTVLTHEEVLLNHPNALIIGKDFPTKGEWKMQGADSVLSDGNLVETLHTHIHRYLINLAN